MDKNRGRPQFGDRTYEAVATSSMMPTSAQAPLGFRRGLLVLHPNQFSPNEAWIFFKLNHLPVPTERDGEFDVIALMDAASLFILGSEFVPVTSLDSSVFEIQRLLEAAHSHRSAWPDKLLISQAAPVANLVAEAKTLGISVAAVSEAELLTFTKEAQQGFKAHFGGGELH